MKPEIAMGRGSRSLFRDLVGLDCVHGVDFVWWTMSFRLWLPMLVLSGCSSPGSDGSLDSDGDGLTDGEEESLGTNPEERDTDGDGYTDGEEVSANTDPTDSEDHAYEGGWEIAACRDEIVSTGNGVGDIAEDFSLLDQHGDRVQLHAFCDSVVWLVGAAFW